MKTFLNFITLTLSITLLFSCAKTGRPEGGPKDEDAPLFITATPPYKTINFNEKKIKLNFNEYIKLKDLNKQLIVSPPLKSPLLVTPQGSASKFLELELLDTLIANTTYTINFGNAIEDNNEGNKLENFKYVFSTGTYIDSLTTSGSIKEAFFNDQLKNTNVLLYKVDSTFNDSIIFKERPDYVTNTLDSTTFNFSNLKKGKYLMIALKESSNDYLFNPKNDKIGFYPTFISLPQDSIIKNPITLFKENQSYELKNAKEVSKGKIAFGYKGLIKKLHVKMMSKAPQEFRSISKFEVDKDTLNYWFTPFEADSLNFIVSNKQFIDTITVKLRKKKTDTLTLTPSTNRTLHFRDTFFIKTNNPLIELDPSKIALINEDTLTIPFNSYISDRENKIGFLFDKKPKQRYTLKLLPSAVTDIYKQQNDTLNYHFNTKEIEDYGRITINIDNQTSENLIIELLEGKNKDKLVERKFISNSKELVFDLLEPKSYFIKAIIDTNKNNQWDTGNYLQKRQPEKNIYYQEELKLRANYYLNKNTFIVGNLN